MTVTFDVAILGGGIIGASVAHRLAKDGLRCVLIEARSFGSGATGRSAAMLEAQLDAHRGEPFRSLGKASNDLFPALALELLESTGIDIQFERCGILQLAFSEENATTLKNHMAEGTAGGFRSTWMSSDDLHRLYPEITLRTYGGVFFHDDGQVHGENYLKALLAAARRRGVTVREGASPARLVTRAGRVEGVTAAGELFSANQYVIAAGAWTDRLLADINLSLGVKPVRGQLVVFDTPRRPLPFPVYTPDRGYVTPKSDGTTLVGSTAEDVGFDESVTEIARRNLKDVASRLFAGLETRPVRGQTAGLRPGSPDALPVIGPLPHHPNVTVATGHFRNGILLAPITAEIIAAALGRRASPVPPEPFLPDRLFSSAR